jgi:xylan 1,4-beta-xylosidase
MSAARYSRRDVLRMAGLGAAALSFPANLRAADAPPPKPSEGRIVVDFSRELGPIKPLHGVNNGPFNWGGRANVSVFHREAGIPWVRLHDVHWPSPDVVDIPCIFPLFQADPEDPGNYLFPKTDAYIKTIVDLGEQIVWRLGVSIEHSGYFYTHPPEDFGKWAKVCVNLIRHYNEGWAGGFHHNIRYWEIWNEPSNGKTMWSGTRDQYFQLYETAAKAIKAHDPNLKVGGPAIGNHKDPWVPAMLAYCRDRKVPLDFFSWHCYSASPLAVKEAADRVRAMLDNYGFKETESHLNEWHYLGEGWQRLRTPDPHHYLALREAYAAINGPEAAAFAAAVLMLLQDSRLDVANYYTGDTSRWGLFDEYGVPKKPYYAFRAFNELCKTPRRIGCTGTSPDARLSVCAGMARDGRAARILLSNFQGAETVLHIELQDLPWQNNPRVEIYRVDAANDFALSATQSLQGTPPGLDVKLPASGICLVKLSAP